MKTVRIALYYSGYRSKQLNTYFVCMFLREYRLADGAIQELIAACLFVHPTYDAMYTLSKYRQWYGYQKWFLKCHLITHNMLLVKIDQRVGFVYHIK